MAPNLNSHSKPHHWSLGLYLIMQSTFLGDQIACSTLTSRADSTFLIILSHWKIWFAVNNNYFGFSWQNVFHHQHLSFSYTLYLISVYIVGIKLKKIGIKAAITFDLNYCNHLVTRLIPHHYLYPCSVSQSKSLSK